jgi:hypothetical protein
VTGQQPLDLRNRRPTGEIGRWWIKTQRANEEQRTGIGRASLLQTLEHLRRRGDRGASYLADVNAGWVHVTFTALPIPGGA